MGFYETTSVATESSYPYTAKDGTCKTSYTTAIPEGGVTGFKDISDESALLDAVANQGPISVAIQAKQLAFQLYSKGVLTGKCGIADGPPSYPTVSGSTAAVSEKKYAR